MDYLDFDLSFRREGDGYLAIVLRSPGGEGQAAFSLPTRDGEYRQRFLDEGLPRRGIGGLDVPATDLSKQFGAKLFDTVFHDDVETCLRVSLGQAKINGAGLRIRLRMNESPELADLPWELLFSARLGNFLSLKTDTPLVRYLELPELIVPLHVELPLRLLVVSTSPSDRLPLDVEDEFRRLLDATAKARTNGSLIVNTLPHATLKSLQSKLQESPVHILHFIGHGDFNESTQQSVVYFEDESGGSKEVAGDFLSVILGNHTSLRLVVLNACHGARSSLKDPFAGVSQSLLRRGVPAVIAMQFAITDNAARVFAEAFYEAIANRFAVDAALVEARTAMYVDERGAEWSTPVLFMRSPDGQIFDIASTPVPKPRHASRLLLAGTLVLIAASGLVAWRLVHSRLRVQRLAVVGPINASHLDNFDYISTAIGDYISLGLSSAGKINSVPREDIAQMMQDVQIPPDVCSLGAHPAPLSKILGASYLIFGQVRKPDDPNRLKEVHVFLCLEDSDGKVLNNWDGYVSEDEVLAAAAVASERFRSSLGDHPPPAQDFQDVYPQNVEARRLYFEGVAELRAFKARKAMDIFEQALKKENSSPQIHEALSDAWSMLRQDREAVSEAKRALEMLQSKPTYPLEFGLLYKAQAEETGHQWDLAAADYGQLFRSNTERLDYGLKLANSQMRGSHIDAALKTIGDLKKLGSPLGDDPRILIAEARIYQAKPDYRKAAQVAMQASASASQAEMRVAKANALFELCWAQIKLDEAKELQSTCDEAKETFSVMGDNVSAAVALNAEANWLSDQGNYKDAKHILKEVITINEAYGAERDLAGALINSANVSIQQNRDAEAGPLLSRARDILRGINEQPDLAGVLINMANVSRENGDLSTSLKQATEALDIARDISNSSLQALALSTVAADESESGNLTDALARYQTALTLRKNLGEKTKIAIMHERIAEVYFRMANFQDAEKECSATLDIYKELGRTGEAAQTSQFAAEIALESGSLQKAEAGARDVIKRFAELDDKLSQADAIALLVRILVAEGKGGFQEAETLVGRMKDLTKPDSASDVDPDPDVELDVALAEGVFLASVHRDSPAYEILDAASKSAHASGRIFVEHELWFAKVEALKGLGNNATVNDQRKGLIESAQKLGFKIISDRVTKL